MSGLNNCMSAIKQTNRRVAALDSGLAHQRRKKRPMEEAMRERTAAMPRNGVIA